MLIGQSSIRNDDFCDLQFARGDQSFRKAGLPVLAEMLITFARLASGAAVGGCWLVQANQFGRATALGVFAVLGLTKGLGHSENNAAPLCPEIRSRNPAMCSIPLKTDPPPHPVTT
jgi:hypothetical protein